MTGLNYNIKKIVNCLVDNTEKAIEGEKHQLKERCKIKTRLKIDTQL